MTRQVTFRAEQIAPARRELLQRTRASDNKQPVVTKPDVNRAAEKPQISSDVFGAVLSEVDQRFEAARPGRLVHTLFHTPQEPVPGRLRHRGVGEVRRRQQEKVCGVRAGGQRSMTLDLGGRGTGRSVGQNHQFHAYRLHVRPQPRQLQARF